jgi:hypothetical protein
MKALVTARNADLVLADALMISALAAAFRSGQMNSQPKPSPSEALRIFRSPTG